MKLFAYDDTLELLGVPAGLLLILMGLGSLLNPPFLTTENTAAALVQTVGILILIGVGLAVISITRPEGLSLPGGDEPGAASPEDDE